MGPMMSNGAMPSVIHQLFDFLKKIPLGVMMISAQAWDLLLIQGYPRVKSLESLDPWSGLQL